MSTTRCRSCGTRIFFAKTSNGKFIPLNVSRETNGNIRLVDGIVEVLSKEETMVPPEDGEERFVSHFSTCPKAKEHRRR